MVFSQEATGLALTSVDIQNVLFSPFGVLAGVAARHHVVDGPLVLDVELSCHADQQAATERSCQRNTRNKV
jgi:hypothetical protein